MKPDIKNRNSEPEYIRSLIDNAGLNQSEAARKLGIDPRTVRRYCQKDGGLKCPYTVQYCLESLFDEFNKGE